MVMVAKECKDLRSLAAQGCSRVRNTSTFPIDLYQLHQMRPCTLIPRGAILAYVRRGICRLLTSNDAAAAYKMFRDTIR